MSTVPMTSSSLHAISQTLSSRVTTKSSEPSASQNAFANLLAEKTSQAGGAAASTITAASSTSATTTASGGALATGGATAVFDTNQGLQTLDIEAYFTPHGNGSFTSATLPPLLFPSEKNITALTSHLSTAFKQFLTENNIPAAPSSITYDRQGKMQLPADYPYASEFKAALEANPSMERELRTVNALTSHYVEMQKSLPFQQEYAAATSKAEIDAVIAKYSYLFSNYRTYSNIALHFSESGGLTLSSDGAPLSLGS